MKSFIVKVTENQLYIKVLRNGNNADCLLDCIWQRIAEVQYPTTEYGGYAEKIQVLHITTNFL